MSSPFEVIKLDVLKLLFEDEIAYLKNHRYDFLQHKPEFIVALSQGVFSTYHIQQIKSMMDIEVAEKIKQEEDAKIVVRNPASLTGSHRTY